jgi:hypothetical protein
LDIVNDFVVGTDKIILNKTTFTALATVAGGNLGSEFAIVTSRTAAEASSALIVYNSVTGGLLYNQNGADAGLGSGARFAILSANLTLTAANITLI